MIAIFCDILFAGTVRHCSVHVRERNTTKLRNAVRQAGSQAGYDQERIKHIKPPPALSSPVLLTTFLYH